MTSHFLLVCFPSQSIIVISDQPSVHLSLATSITDSVLTATLTCLVDSSPPASVTWTKDGEEVKTVEPGASRSVLEQLVITPVGAGSFGNYSCTAFTTTTTTANNNTATDSVEFSGEQRLAILSQPARNIFSSRSTRGSRGDEQVDVRLGQGPRGELEV